MEKCKHKPNIKDPVDRIEAGRFDCIKCKHEFKRLHVCPKCGGLGEWALIDEERDSKDNLIEEKAKWQHECGYAVPWLIFKSLDRQWIDCETGEDRYFTHSFEEGIDKI